MISHNNLIEDLTTCIAIAAGKDIKAILPVNRLDEIANF